MLSLKVIHASATTAPTSDDKYDNRTLLSCLLALFFTWHSDTCCNPRAYLTRPFFPPRQCPGTPRSGAAAARTKCRQIAKQCLRASNTTFVWLLHHSKTVPVFQTRTFSKIECPTLALSNCTSAVQRATKLYSRWTQRRTYGHSQTCESICSRCMLALTQY